MRVVLVVDDDDSVRDFICAALQTTDVIVLPASGADDALKVVEAWRVHVALVDVGLPDTDGRELAAVLTGMQPELRVVLMSGEELPGCLLKPLGVAELRRAVGG